MRTFEYEMLVRGDDSYDYEVLSEELEDEEEAILFFKANLIGVFWEKE